jgi:hypothetical protein
VGQILLEIEQVDPEGRSPFSFEGDSRMLSFEAENIDGTFSYDACKYKSTSDSIKC